MQMLGIYTSSKAKPINRTDNMGERYTLSQRTYVQIQFTTCVTKGKTFLLSRPQLPHL